MPPIFRISKESEEAQRTEQHSRGIWIRKHRTLVNMLHAEGCLQRGTLKTIFAALRMNSRPSSCTCARSSFNVCIRQGKSLRSPRCLLCSSPWPWLCRKLCPLPGPCPSLQAWGWPSPPPWSWLSRTSASDPEISGGVLRATFQLSRETLVASERAYLRAHIWALWDLCAHRVVGDFLSGGPRSLHMARRNNSKLRLRP